MVKDTGNISNTVRRCCVGGYMTILVFGSFQKNGGNCKDSIKLSKKGNNFSKFGAKWLEDNELFIPDDDDDDDDD